MPNSIEWNEIDWKDPQLPEEEPLAVPYVPTVMDQEVQLLTRLMKRISWTHDTDEVSLKIFNDGSGYVEHTDDGGTLFEFNSLGQLVREYREEK